MAVLKRLLVALVLLLTTSGVDAASEGTYQVFRSWTERNGLPGSQVWAVTQDLDGYIWLGTSIGLVRFDGVRFDDSIGERGLPARAVRSLCVSRDRNLWIGFGGAGGISRLGHGIVTNYDVRDGIPGGQVIGLVEGHDGTIWAASTEGVAQFRDGHWRLLESMSGLPTGRALAVYVDQHGTVWVAKSSGVFRRNPGETVFSLSSSASDVSALSEDSSGALLTTDPNRGYRRFDGRDPVDQAARRPFVRGLRLHHDGLGNLWMGTLGQGLFRFSRNQYGGFVTERFGVENGLTSETVWSMLTDREGSVWIGTQNGLNQLTKRVATTLPTDGNPPMSTLIRAVAASMDGAVWVGTADGLHRFVGSAHTRFDRWHGLPSASIVSIHADRDGRLWVATNSGVAAFDGKLFSRLPLHQGVRLNRVIAMATDSFGGLWLLDGDHGLFKREADTLIHVGDSAKGKTARVLFADRQGRVWIGYQEGGLAKYEKGTFVLLDQSDGLTAGTVTNLYEDSDGTLWISANGGLSWLRRNQLHIATRNNGLPLNAVSAIIEDSEGHLWLGSKFGILRVAKRQFNSIDADPAYQLPFTLFASADGVRGNPIALGSPVARAGDGSLWFATSDGITIVNPRYASKRSTSPSVAIEAVIVDERQIDHTAEHALPARVGRLEIRYTALSFLAPSTLRFRYRLDGHDSDWVNVEHQRQAVYTSLSPGRYRFRVVAGNYEGWNGAGEEWVFAVAPIFYQTLWFKLGSSTGLALLVGTIWRLRARNLRASLLLVIAERARVSREIHDTLLQTVLVAAIEVDKVATDTGPEHDSTRRRLFRLREHLQSAVREMRQSIWDLRSPILSEQLNLPVALKQECQAIAADVNALQLEFSVSGKPRPVHKVDEHLFRLGREAVRNAVRHAGASLVKVQLSYRSKSILLKIIDDGHGFILGDVVKGASAHWGIAMMEERAKRIGATFGVSSRPGMGTEIEVVVQL